MPDSPPFAPEPPAGRVFPARRYVRATDAAVTGRLRLDALARYLQDVAFDDMADSGWQPPYGWLLRRCAVTARDYPRVAERVTLRTFCSGTGPRWAERTTTVSRAGTAVIQAVAVWVAADPVTGRLCRLGDDFARVYGAAAGGRRVSARLTLPGPGPDAAARAWPARAADFDVAGHMNNTVYWAALEDVIAGAGGTGPRQAVLEYQRPVLPGDPLVLRTAVAAASPDGPGHTGAWLTGADAGTRYASGRLRFAA